MITIKNVKTLDGEINQIQISSTKDYLLDAEGHLLLPGLIDSHLSLGSPEREDWAFSVESVLRGGITTILDIPSHDSPAENKLDLEQKRALVNKKLLGLNIPLSTFFYSKGNIEYIEEMGLEKSLMIGSVILLAPENPILEESSWKRLFQMAAWEDLPVVVNAQNENSWQNTRFGTPRKTFLEKAIDYAESQNTRLYVLNVGNRNEVDLIEQARSRSVLVYAETTPQHLFPQDAQQADFLWEAIGRGVIEAIGSGYLVDAQIPERLVCLGENFDFLNPMFLLPLLLTAYHEGKISLEKIVRLTRVNLYDIFDLKRKDQDVVLVDLQEEREVQRISKNETTKMKLKGWPKTVIVKGEIFTSSQTGYHLSHI